MPEPLNVGEYLGYLRRRWRFCAAAAASAFILSLGFSLLLPKQYTATASILIDAPGADPRTSTAVSSIYLESLKTYEHFAESDTIFLQALEKFRLRDEYPAAAADSLKRRVLRVTLPRDTKILQVSATLRDPRKAQALTEYIAEQTVGMNRQLSEQTDQDLISEGQRQLDAARAKLQQSEKALGQESAQSPYQSLQDEVDNLMELRARLRRDLLDAKVDIADYAAQGNQRELASVRARADTLEKQVADLDRELQAKEKAVAERRTRWETLNADIRAARAAEQSAEGRLNDIRAGSSVRSERLRIIDPGIVPQHPSSPNILLNVAAAVLVALILAWLYLTVAYNVRGYARYPTAHAYSAER